MNSIIRRIFVCLLTTLLLSIAQLVGAQQPNKVPRIGFLVAGSPSNTSLNIEAFRQGLRELGYIEGKNITIEYRHAEGVAKRFPILVAELLRLDIDIIVATGPTIVAAKNATKTIPLVMTNYGDPVGTGVVASLARPGGNVTGLSSFSSELGGKRLQLLKEAFPRVSRVAVLWDPANVANALWLEETKVAAKALRVTLQPLEVHAPNDFDLTFSAIKRERAGAVIVVRNPLTSTHRSRISDFAAQSRLPAIYSDSDFVDAGGLMSYGPNYNDLYRRAATYVDKILKGAKPADLPVEQPTKFEFVINLKTAKQIGLTIPPNVLARADRVIR
jgi:putative ABC transport system substrate-binding protein